METGSILNYPRNELVLGASLTRLAQLLEQEGQPCSYCIAVFLIQENGEGLAYRDRWAYAEHLVKDHHLKPYHIQP